MKKIKNKIIAGGLIAILILLTLSFPTYVSAQSISPTRLKDYLSIQDEGYIESDIVEKDFKYLTTILNDNGHAIIGYFKTINGEAEVIGFAKNDKIFVIIYNPFDKYYRSYKEALFIKSYKFSFKSDNTYLYDGFGLRLV